MDGKEGTTTELCDVGPSLSSLVSPQVVLCSTKERKQRFVKREILKSIRFLTWTLSLQTDLQDSGLLFLLKEEKTQSLCKLETFSAPRNHNSSGTKLLGTTVMSERTAGNMNN